MSKEFVQQIVDGKLWEEVPAKNQVILCGDKLSLNALDVAFDTLEDRSADVIVTSSRIWKNMDEWGYGNASMSVDGEIVKDMELLRAKEDQVSIWGADIHIVDEIPENTLLVGSKSNNSFAKICIVE